VCYVPIALLALGGIPWLFRPAFRPALAVLIALPPLYALFSDDRRFFVIAVPAVVALAAAALERLAARSARAALGLAAALALAFGVYDLAHPLTDDAPEHRAAGVWLRSAWRGAPGARPVVMSRKSWVAYYANASLSELPEGGVDSVLARAARREVDVLVVDERWAARTRPELRPWLEPGVAPRGWVTVKRIAGPHPLVLDVPIERAAAFSRSGSP